MYGDIQYPGAVAARSNVEQKNGTFDQPLVLQFKRHWILRAKNYIRLTKSNKMKRTVKEINTCFELLEEGVDLLLAKSGYLQTTVIKKLQTLNVTISPAWLSAALKQRKAGFRTLKIVTEGLESIILQEHGLKYDPGQKKFIEARPQNWQPQIVRETTAPDHQFGFHPNGRVSVQEKTDFIATAIQEVIEMGVRLNTFSNYFISHSEQSYKTHIINLLQRGVHIRGYLIDPDSNEARLYFEDRAQIQPLEKDAIGGIKKAIERLNVIAADLSATPGPGKFEIYQYRHIPYAYFLVVDGASDSGKMMVSPYLYGVSRANCPVLVLNKKEHTSLFIKYWESLQFMTENAKQLI